MGLFRYIKQDFPNRGFIRTYFGGKGSQAIILFRLSQYLYNHNLKTLSFLIKNRNIRLTGCDIDPAATIGKGVRIGHPVGIVISGKAVVGENVLIHDGVLMGTKNYEEWNSNVHVGDNVEIGSGAKLMGNITIGKDAIIGANAVVIEDVPEGSIAVGIPARIIKK